MSADAFPAHESTRKRRRWGCTCGCVGLLAILSVVGVFFLYGFLKPNSQFPKDSMFDSSINGFGVVRVDSSDGGQGELLKFVFKRAEKAQLEGLSEGDAKVMSLFLKILRQLVTTLVQTDCPVYISYDTDAQQESMLTVLPLRNKMSFLLLRKFLTSHVEQPQDHKADSDIYPLAKITADTSTSVMAVSQKEFVYSDDLKLLNRSLDYRADPNHHAEPPEKLAERMDELSLDKPPAGEDIALLFTAEPGRLQHLLAKCESAVGLNGFVAKLQDGLVAQKLSLNDVLAWKVSIDLVSVDRAKIETTLYFRQTDVSARFAAALKLVLPMLSGKHEGSMFEFKQDVRTRGIPVVVSLDMSGIRKWLESIMPEPQPAESKEPAVATDDAAAGSEAPAAAPAKP